ncbi:unnamed protein product [Sphagnum balticum]
MQHYISIEYRKALLGGFCFVEFGPVLRIFRAESLCRYLPIRPCFFVSAGFRGGKLFGCGNCTGRCCRGGGLVAGKSNLALHLCLEASEFPFPCSNCIPV